MPTINKTPEQIARDNIDKMLITAGWVVQAKKELDWKAGPGIAVTDGVNVGNDVLRQTGQPEPRRRTRF